MTDRRVTCRYLCRDGNRCTAEVVDPDPKAIQLCIKHLGRAVELVRDMKGRRTPTATRTPTGSR